MTITCVPTDTLQREKVSPEAALTLYWKNGKVATTDGP